MRYVDQLSANFYIRRRSQINYSKRKGKLFIVKMSSFTPLDTITENRYV